MVLLKDSHGSFVPFNVNVCKYTQSIQYYGKKHHMPKEMVHRERDKSF